MARSQEEACFEQALSIACEQQARLWELRAATSPARLRLSHGGRGDARRLLDDVAGLFAEDSALADVHRARALRAELRHRAIRGGAPSASGAAIDSKSVGTS